MVVRGLWLLVLCALVLSGLARAQVDDEALAMIERNARAKALFDEGLARAQRGDWEPAQVAFAESSALVPRASTLYNLARARFELGQLLPCIEALDQLESIEAPAERAAYRDYAAQLLARVLAKRVYLRIEIVPANATLTVDGEPDTAHDTVPVRRLLLPAGQHELVVSAAGYLTERWLVLGSEGERLGRALHLTPQVPALVEAVAPPPTAAVAPADSARAPAAALRATPAPARSNTLAWVGVGVGAAALVAAVITGVAARNADRDFLQRCPGRQGCAPELRPIKERAATFALATDVLMVGGVVVMGSGGLMMLLGSDDPDPPRAER